jgi:hypothetical protein
VLKHFSEFVAFGKILHFAWLKAHIFLLNLYIYIYIYISSLLPPLWRTGHPWNALFHFNFLILWYSVGPLGWGISPSQGRYLYKHRINTDTHPCLEWDSNPRSLRLSGRRQCWIYRSDVKNYVDIFLFPQIFTGPMFCEPCETKYGSNSIDIPLSYYLCSMIQSQPAVCDKYNSTLYTCVNTHIYTLLF